MKNIKKSLTRIQKYILDETIKGSKANNVKDLKGIGKVAWRFISSLYEAHWDSLIVVNSNTSFRNRVMSKFSPQVVKTSSNGKGKNIVKPASILFIPPSILAKSPKEVYEILKFFKKSLLFNRKSHMPRHLLILICQI